MNSTQEEAVSTLLEWARKDEENRSVMLIAGDEKNVRNAYRGSRRNLIVSLANAMLKDKDLRSMCAEAYAMCEKYKENDNDGARAE